VRQVTSSGKVNKQQASRWFGISRQAYYQALKRELQKAAEDQLLVMLVQDLRRRHPRMGGRKLHHELQESMAALGISRGRDTFFNLLRDRDLLVPVKRSRRRTTWPGLWRYPNLLTDLEIRQIHQVWVADITYITTEQGFLYLALITDAFSRFIVGYDLSTSLAVESSLLALNQAIDQASPDTLSGLIHHSDHGVQYTAYPYRDRLQEVGIQASMGAIGNCYENAMAERVNGILKIEYALDALFVNFDYALQAVSQAIWLYNYERPHLSLDYAKPAEIHFHLDS